MKILRSSHLLDLGAPWRPTTHTQSATQGGDGLPTNSQGETSPLHAAHRTNGGERETSATEPHPTAGERDEARVGDSPMTASVSETTTSFHRPPSLVQSAFRHYGGAEKIDAAQGEKPMRDIPEELKKERGNALDGDGTYFDPKLKVLLTGTFKEGALESGRILSKHHHKNAVLWDFKVVNKKIVPTPEQMLMGTCILPEYYATRPRFDGEAKEIKGDIKPATNEFWQALYDAPGASGEVNEGVDKSESR